ncbi:MAG: efflux RND transporter permease subunit [Planctomycetes bacterium]|nr:efflux RND transporter permease subunit [Planctomycetota bacterium]
MTILTHRHKFHLRKGTSLSLTKITIEKKTFAWFATVVLLLAGIASFFGLGQLEDPEFTVKNASIFTSYPGATAEEVELEVTDRLEMAIQELPQLKQIKSISRAGSSQILVTIKASYTSAKLPQVWDELRKKIRDARADLPPGAGTPVVGDDFGDVYGFLMAVTGDGFSYAELESYVDLLKKELSLIDGVARVELWGVQKRCIYINVAQTQLSQLGISMEDIQRTLSMQNVVVDSGGVDLADQRMRIEQTGAFKDPEDIANLVVRGRDLSPFSQNNELIRIGDIGTVQRGYVAPPMAMMRYNGQPAIGLSISNASGANIVDLGERIDRRLSEITNVLPIGIEIHRVSWQSDAVSESIRSFIVSLFQAVAIVIVVLLIAMGWRTALIVGMAGLVFTILMSLLVMKLWGIDLQRMSLGALIIAMGMMVDNAIVVVDGIVVRMQRGMNRVEAAIEAATQPSMPLLGATVIAVMAFYPIYASPESAGEYCESLFQVVAISLLISWLLAVTVAPLLCIWVLPEPKARSEDEDEYGGRLFQVFRGVLEKAIRLRWPLLGALGGLLVLSAYGFQFTDKTFFPESARPQLMIEYWSPEGTRIQRVSTELTRIEEHLMSDDRIESVSAFIGQGPPRFYLPVEPEKPYQSYAQLIVNLKSPKELNNLVTEINDWLDHNVPEARSFVRRYGLGPSNTWKVELRISGSGVADAKILREKANEAVAIFQNSKFNKIARTNWRRNMTVGFGIRFRSNISDPSRFDSITSGG